ncbi:hypothetical protein BFP77_01760 [Maribacter sp. 4U21]|uniref:hypothetical protein n=1 Tax=Maribacter sp. 4U21 TaxID=1889779 RepID=UPI000C161006|nr:hypothetical protein [Maribacter sp. 4U21]PIB31321.1 hypothetical protein BFP77_01760 [Maribacter sp. 4U21]
MDENTIAEIVRMVFEKAKKEHASHSRFALSKHVSDHSDLSSKTLERAYDRYVNQKRKHGIPQAESVELFCKYLGFESYSDFVRRNPTGIPKNGKPQKNKRNVNREGWKKLIVIISIASGLIIMISDFQKWYANSKNRLEYLECMTWADSLYVTISCDRSPLSEYGTQVKPLDPLELKNMRKVKVNAAYQFFSDEGKPLIWYYRNEEDEHEFFTSPGLHPVNGETLRKITPYIIQKYVPFHTNNRNSFAQ